MDKYSESELLPTYQKFHRSQIDGKRTVVEIAFTPKINPESKATITIPKLRPNMLIDPNTICLTATLENSNDKSILYCTLRLFQSTLTRTFLLSTLHTHEYLTGERIKRTLTKS
jgi:hypothetical protein